MSGRRPRAPQHEQIEHADASLSADRVAERADQQGGAPVLVGIRGAADVPPEPAIRLVAEEFCEHLSGTPRAELDAADAVGGSAPMRRSSLGWPFSQAASCCSGSMRRTLSHLACSGAAAAAAWATLSTGLTKAAKLASRTICNSPFAARRIAASSSAAKVAPRLGWRSVRACTRFLGAKSCTKAAPLTFAGRSTRGTLRPTTL